MSVEKMMMVNLVGRIEEIDRVSKKIVILGAMHAVSAMEEVNTTDFAIEVSEKNKEALIEFNYIRPFMNSRDYDSFEKKLAKVKLMCCNHPDYSEVGHEDLIFDFEELNDKLDEVLDKFEDVIHNLDSKKEEIERHRELIDRIELLKGIDIPLEDITGMKNFSSTMLKISSANMTKLSHNIENIPAVFFSLDKGSDYEIIFMLIPDEFELEVNRILKSLDCEEIAIDSGLKGTPYEIAVRLHERIEVLDGEISRLKEQLEEVSEETDKSLGIIFKSAELEMKSNSLKDSSVCSDDFFYMVGWVPKSKLERFKDEMSAFEDDMTLSVESVEETSGKVTPPTKLKNNLIFRPFEAMVNLYGIPSYREIDPTAFLGLSYMILFGAMFGDVGQGALLFLAGIAVKRLKKMISQGEIVMRLGIASMAFGFVYGSVFGFETIINPLLIRPMENITEILVYAVVFGLLLMTVGFALNMVNSIRRKDLERGLFGKDGAAGLVLYLAAVVFAVTKYEGIYLMSGAVWLVVFLVPILLILLKEPLVNAMKRRRPLFTESKRDYFIEGGFGVVEVVLSMFTNTLSFIRVGAFALNHVGLFLAFTILASMMQSGVGSALVYIVGNIVIVGLEGLIVFVQGLRLEYYELFSKYYEGYGIAFKPVRLEE